MECLECGKETSNNKFCSLSCSAKTQRRNFSPRKRKEQKQCLQCSTLFYYGYSTAQKFCSSSCSATYNNIKRGQRHPLRHCEYCGKALTKASQRKNKYCSSPCSAQSISKAVIDAWIRDPNTATQKQGLSRSVKLYLIREAENKCTQCGWGEINPATGKSPLEIDHIDGDCYNNFPDNLRVLCPNCHSLTPTYKALNKNGKRKYR
jgi:hypothetical protein